MQSRYVHVDHDAVLADQHVGRRQERAASAGGARKRLRSRIHGANGSTIVAIATSSIVGLEARRTSLCSHSVVGRGPPASTRSAETQAGDVLYREGDADCEFIVILEAEKFGARILVPAEATAIAVRDGGYDVTFGDDKQTVHATSVVVSRGVRYRRLPIPRLEQLEGVRVYYAATLMEAQMCAGDPIVVVGGGNSAGQATLFLAEYVPKIHLVVREPELQRDMSRCLTDRIERTPNVELHTSAEVRELVGERAPEAVVVENNQTGQRDTLDARAMFVFIGAEPHTDWLGGLVELDSGGYVKTGRDVTGFAGCDGDRAAHQPLILETSQPGVFAAGDVRSGSIKRVAAAVGEGSMAVRLVHEHLAGRHHVDRATHAPAAAATS
jgi:thioredoxin reductase (NADPH)